MCGDWYAHNMYIQGHRQYNYHVRHYGHPSKFGYKDICALWKAEKFDPDDLMDLFVKAGARYFVAQAMHHDNFFNFPSQYNRFNSMQVGPHKDICGLWKQAADKHGLPFGLTEHLATSFTFMASSKMHDTYGPYKDVPYDGNDPAYQDFYHRNQACVTQTGGLERWYTIGPEFHAYWHNVLKELIDLYQPELLYSDGGLPFGSSSRSTPDDPLYRPGLEMLAYFYNTSIQKHGVNRAVYTQKDRRPEYDSIGVLNIEKSQLPDAFLKPWQTDTCIGNWFYDAQQTYTKPKHIIEMLVDIVSKNGTMLLNVLQRPDGSLDDEALYILEELAAWFRICGEGIYGTNEGIDRRL